MPANPVRAIICNTANKHLVITVQRPAGERVYAKPTPASRARIAALTAELEPVIMDKLFIYRFILQPA